MNLIVLVVDITFQVFCDDWWMYCVIEIIQNKNLVFLHHCYLWWEDIEPACYVLVMGLIDVICSILWNYWWMNSLFVCSLEYRHYQERHIHTEDCEIPSQSLFTCSYVFWRKRRIVIRCYHWSLKSNDWKNLWWHW